jgi:hypothetical protein
MKLLLAFVLLVLPGCSQISAAIPSLQHCDRVSYLREGNQIDIQAKCSAPIGGSVPGL